jgi:hypothetical protein
MLNKVGVFVFLCLFSLLTNWISAAASTISIQQSGPSIQSLTELTAGNTSRALALLTVDSTSSSNFTISMTSANAGFFVRKVSGSYVTPVLTGDSISYTLSVVGNGTGTLGCTEPNNLLNNDLSSQLNFLFTTPTADTVGKEYLLQFTLPSKTSLFEGTFADDITVTISDV